jgi:hypothetical protein
VGFNGIREVSGRSLVLGAEASSGGQGRPDYVSVGVSRGVIHLAGVSGEGRAAGHADSSLIGQLIPGDANVGLHFQEVSVVAEVGPACEEVGNCKEEVLMLIIADLGRGLKCAPDLVEGAQAVCVEVEFWVSLLMGVFEGHVDGTQFSSVDGMGLG